MKTCKIKGCNDPIWSQSAGTQRLKDALPTTIGGLYCVRHQTGGRSQNRPLNVQECAECGWMMAASEQETCAFCAGDGIYNPTYARRNSV